MAKQATVKKGREDGVVKPPTWAYISAPPGIDTRPLRQAFAAKGVHAFSPDQLDLPGLLSDVLRGSCSERMSSWPSSIPLRPATSSSTRSATRRGWGSPLLFSSPGTHPLPCGPRVALRTSHSTWTIPRRSISRYSRSWRFRITFRPRLRPRRSGVTRSKIWRISFWLDCGPKGRRETTGAGGGGRYRHSRERGDEY